MVSGLLSFRSLGMNNYRLVFNNFDIPSHQRYDGPLIVIVAPTLDCAEGIVLNHYRISRVIVPNHTGIIAAHDIPGDSIILNPFNRAQ